MGALRDPHPAPEHGPAEIRFGSFDVELDYSVPFAAQDEASTGWFSGAMAAQEQGTLMGSGVPTWAERVRRLMRMGSVGIEYAGDTNGIAKDFEYLVDGVPPTATLERPAKIAGEPAERELPTRGFVALCVAEVKKTGIPPDCYAERLRVRRQLLDAFEKRGMRPSHVQEWIDLAVEAVFTPSMRQIQVRALTADPGLHLRKAAYGKMRRGFGWWGSCTTSVAAPK